MKKNHSHDNENEDLESYEDALDSLFPNAESEEEIEEELEHQLSRMLDR